MDEADALNNIPAFRAETMYIYQGRGVTNNNSSQNTLA